MCVSFTLIGVVILFCSDSGLGKGINMCQLNPWENRSIQCRRVFFSDITVNTENTRHEFEEVIESESSRHGKASIGANIPEAFTKVNVAFDKTRDETKSKRVAIKCLTKAKYFFKTDDKEESDIEQALRRFKDEEEHEYGDQWCEVFLRKNNYITHYVSSIVLGAMTCTVLEQSAREDGVRFNAGIEAPRAAHLSGGVGSTTQAKYSTKNTLEVGAFTPDENAVAVPGVIHYEYKPLIDLVSDPTLKSALYLAVTKYQASKSR